MLLVLLPVFRSEPSTTCTSPACYWCCCLFSDPSRLLRARHQHATGVAACFQIRAVYYVHVTSMLLVLLPIFRSEPSTTCTSPACYWCCCLFSDPSRLLRARHQHVTGVAACFQIRAVYYVHVTSMLLVLLPVFRSEPSTTCMPPACYWCCCLFSDPSRLLRARHQHVTGVAACFQIRAVYYVHATSMLLVLLPIFRSEPSTTCTPPACYWCCGVFSDPSRLLRACHQHVTGVLRSVLQHDDLVWPSAQFPAGCPHCDVPSGTYCCQWPHRQ